MSKIIDFIKKNKTLCLVGTCIIIGILIFFFFSQVAGAITSGIASLLGFANKKVEIKKLEDNIKDINVKIDESKTRQTELANKILNDEQLRQKALDEINKNSTFKKEAVSNEELIAWAKSI